ncbi:MAG: hypothetical protein V1837_05665 [Candidatus Woesearchaeota archaeon]
MRKPQILRNTILKDIKQTFLLPLSNKLYFILSVASDILFFMTFLLTFAIIQQRIFDYIGFLMNAAQTDISNVSGLVANQNSMVDVMLNKPEFAYYFTKALQLLLLLMALAMVVYCVFQGLVWLFCNRVVDRRTKASYLLRFLAVNIIWLSLFYCFIYTWVKLSVYATFSIFPLVSRDFVTVLFIICTFALAYFAFVSYPLLRKTGLKKIFQKTFIVGFKDYKKILLTFLPCLVIIAVLVILGFLLSSHFVLFLLYLLVIVFPLLTILRIFAILRITG